jgi:hypothetical protein
MYAARFFLDGRVVGRPEDDVHDLDDRVGRRRERRERRSDRLVEVVLVELVGCERDETWPCGHSGETSHFISRCLRGVMVTPPSRRSSGACR